MARYENASGGAIVLPDGVKIDAGGFADIADDVASIPGVAQLIDAGFLEKTKAKPGPKPKDE
ncbi:MAG: hypothetical protein U5N55_01575 [Cypionkella sp.]|nr:hypothetical protein [Cypionkella sp.]